MDFKNAEAFRHWLEIHHASAEGRNIFIYKKGHQDKGMSYEEAVQTALCFGWIDAVTHAYDEEKFIQYFARRLKTSNWSISNIKRMKALIESGLMTEDGLTFFDMALIDQLPALEAQNKERPEMPDYFLDMLENQHMIEMYEALSKSVQHRYIGYILDAKQEKTRLRRCQKIIDILNGANNNL